MRKGFTALSWSDFYDWYHQQEPGCYYYRIRLSEIKQLLDQGKIYTKPFATRGRSLELEGLLPNESYKLVNIKLRSYWCNNAKSDEFGEEELAHLGKAIWLFEEKGYLCDDTNIALGRQALMGIVFYEKRKKKKHLLVLTKLGTLNLITPQMKSIQEIFENSLFRIPDYQRGFAWKNTHLDDFWQDLRNLRNDRFHYTGALTLEKPTVSDVKKWKGDEWIIQTGSYKPYYVVDGQQRITTVIILLNVLIDLMSGEEQYLYQNKEELIAKYIYKRNDKNKLQSYIFGYEIDDPSYEYLKTRIFRQDSTDASNHPETSYTNNLELANLFFKERTKELSHELREELFRKVTQQLKFDLKIVENDLDIFVVFETMNNRGKPLSNLEKLKNRLIYLTTLMSDLDENERKQLRKEINEVWKTCYEFLGKNKNNPLNDDTFLRNHFIVYHLFEKQKEFPYWHIFKNIYTVENTVSTNPVVTFKYVQNYIRSLQKASQIWYTISNPTHAFHADLLSDEETEWLQKLQHLGLRVFGPLTLSVFLVTKDIDDRLRYLKAVESFIFLNYLCAGRRSNLGNSDFPYIANYLYNRKRSYTVQKVIDEINAWTYGNDDYNGWYSNDGFISNIKDLFTTSKKNGYYDWSGLRYLLFEYEDFLRGGESPKVKWTTPNSIEHIYPQEESKGDWKEVFRDFTPKERKVLCNTIGNLVLLRLPKNSQLSNNSFEFKKKHSLDDGTIGGYAIGSHNEIAVAQAKSWNAKAIFKRGKNILNFLQNRWNITLTSPEIRQLILIDEQLWEKVKQTE